MRERVEHGEVGCTGIGGGVERAAGPRSTMWRSWRVRVRAALGSRPVEPHLEVWSPVGGPLGERPVVGRLRGGPSAAAGGARVGRRPAGPRPARPGSAQPAVRPPEAPRPAGPGGRPVVSEAWGERAGLRVLPRRSVPRFRRELRGRLRRALAGAALMAATAAAVVMLGLLARIPAPPPVAVSGLPAPVVVTATPGETVWEVVDRVAPGLSGPQRAELAERIVPDNRLASVRLQPGQVLRVPGG
jgi:hypothetical protein